LICCSSTWQRGQCLGAGSVEHLVAQQASLQDQQRLALGEVLHGLGHRGDVTGRAIRLGRDEGEGGRTDEHVVDIDSQLLRREADERVLVHLVLAACRPHRGPQGAQFGDLQAAVLGEEHSIGSFELAAHLLDDADLLGSWILHVLHLLPIGFETARERSGGCPHATTTQGRSRTARTSLEIR